MGAGTSISGQRQGRWISWAPHPTAVAGSEVYAAMRSCIYSALLQVRQSGGSQEVQVPVQVQAQRCSGLPRLRLSTRRPHRRRHRKRMAPFLALV